MKNLAIIGVLGFVFMAGDAAAGGAYTPPRAPDGRPDLQGVWANSALTDLQRQDGVTKLVVSPAEAAKLAKAHPLQQLADTESVPSRPDDGLQDGNASIGYNAFWGDPGQQLGKVKGEFRTSWIVEPADGLLPLSEAGKRKVDAMRAEQERTFFEGPEGLQPANRCIIGLNGSGGPGMINPMYNGNYQFLQRPDTMVILVEMVHDARIVPIGTSRAAAQALRGPPTIKKWLGDSVGWWEGDTFVVETINTNPQQGQARPFYLSDKGKVTERFTRVAADEIFYEFVVEDAEYYRQPWKAEMSFHPRKEPIYEYACHEGNYSMPGILAGARKVEAEGGRPSIEGTIAKNWRR